MAAPSGSSKPSFNHIESFHEIPLSPEELKRIAGEIERMEQEFHTPGQVIRYKLSHNFCIVYKPEKKRNAAARVDKPVPQTFHSDMVIPTLPAKANA